MGSLGATIRGLFGRHERTVAELYRRGFVDLDALVESLADLHPERVLEIGCGEGAMTSRLARSFPEARITAIDLTPKLGRLYEGDPARVEFRCESVEALAGAAASTFDLVLLCDVLHHIPPSERNELLKTVRSLLSPGGTFLFKDWERRQTPVHWAAAASDRFLSGDDVHFCSLPEMLGLLRMAFPEHEVLEQPPVPPWAHNRVIRVRPRT